MRVRDWQDIMDDVVENDVEPDGWRAVGGDRANGIGEDLYVGHPGVGVFQLKTYAKNPFEVQGVGARVARRIDDELDPLFPRADDAAGQFGVQQPPEDEDEAERAVRDLETVVETHADAPTSPRALFEDIMDALDSPAYGPMEFDHHDRPDPMDDLTDTFEEAEELLDAEFEDVVDEDVERGFY
jgi:plasmid stabilization system protein ParE